MVVRAEVARSARMCCVFSFLAVAPPPEGGGRFRRWDEGIQVSFPIADMNMRLRGVGIPAPSILFEGLSLGQQLGPPYHLSAI